MLDPDPAGPGQPAILVRLLETFFPKRSQLERVKSRALRAFFLLAVVVGGADIWAAALAQLDRLEFSSATIRLILDATPTKEPYVGVLVLALAALFLSIESVVNLLADRVQGSDPRP